MMLEAYFSTIGVTDMQQVQRGAGLVSAADRSTATADGSSPQSPLQTVTSNVCVLQLDYESATKTFFKEEMPIALEAHITADEFKKRMRGINTNMSTFCTLRDFTPVIRGGIFSAFTIYTIAIVLCVTHASSLVLWGAVFTGLVAVMGAMIWTYKKPRCVAFLEGEVARFSELDADIPLKWRSIRHCPIQMYSWDVSKSCTQVPWKIVIVLPPVACDETSEEYLPMYEGPAESSFLICESGVERTLNTQGESVGGGGYVSVDMGRLPSYKDSLA
ncbi:hypothetical protein BC830DRAFT_256190 [Chytriomyces sp. MP71]|nr:hypothetical protein BC830DRAFT_256190 [Chytriomyces sp. MP71]